MEKHLLTVAGLLFLGCNAFAQDTPDEFSDRVKHIFQHVNTTPVTSGILLDCGVEFLNMNNHTGTTVHDSNFVSLSQWRAVYSSLLSSQFNSQVSFTDFAIINSRINLATADNLPVPFVFLHYDYQTLRSDAISAGLLYNGSRQYQPRHTFIYQHGCAAAGC